MFGLQPKGDVPHGELVGTRSYSVRLDREKRCVSV